MCDDVARACLGWMCVPSQGGEKKQRLWKLMGYGSLAAFKKAMSEEQQRGLAAFLHDNAYHSMGTAEAQESALSSHIAALEADMPAGSAGRRSMQHGAQTRRFWLMRKRLQDKTHTIGPDGKAAKVSLMT